MNSSTISQSPYYAKSAFFFPLCHNQLTNSYNRQPRPQTFPFKTLHLLEMLCWMKNRTRDTGDFIKTKKNP